MNLGQGISPLPAGPALVLSRLGSARRRVIAVLTHPTGDYWALRFVRYLSTVPESDDPYLVFTNAIEEPVGLDVDFAVGEFRKLRDDRSRLGETSETLERFCRLLLEPSGRGSILSPDRFDGGEELHPRRWREEDLHAQPSDKRASASATPARGSAPPRPQSPSCHGPARAGVLGLIRTVHRPRLIRTAVARPRWVMNSG